MKYEKMSPMIIFTIFIMSKSMQLVKLHSETRVSDHLVMSGG